MVHRLAGLAIVGSALVVTGCGASTPPAATTGVLTGVAYPCLGLAAQSLGATSAHVEVYRSGRLVLSRVIPSGGTYRIVLSAGSYNVSDTGLSGVGSHHVVVRAARTTHQDLPDLCE